VTEAEKKTVTATVSTSPTPAPAPIVSWLRQAAAEIEAKKGNPNLVARTRQYGRSTTLNTSPSPRSYTMGDSNVSGKLQQKDYTPEVDGLLPEATALAQVGFACFAPSCTLFLTIAVAFYLGRAAPGGAGEALRSREASKKRASPLVVYPPGSSIVNCNCAYVLSRAPI